MSIMKYKASKEKETMKNEEALKKFQEEVEWLKTVIDPNDIYTFANQALLGAYFFLNEWSDWVDIEEECDKDQFVKGWVTNLCSIHSLRKLGSTQKISVRWSDI